MSEVELTERHVPKPVLVWCGAFVYVIQSVIIGVNALGFNFQGINAARTQEVIARIQAETVDAGVFGDAHLKSDIEKIKKDVEALKLMAHRPASKAVN